MPGYIAEKVLSGSQDYKKVFVTTLYRRYQNDVDIILIGEGRNDLIVK